MGFRSWLMSMLGFDRTTSGFGVADRIGDIFHRRCKRRLKPASIGSKSIHGVACMRYGNMRSLSIFRRRN
jgi:hypothetical protein